MTISNPNVHERLFVRGAFRRFYVPALLSGVWMTFAGVADSVFVGHGLGAAGLAAISLGQPVYLFYNILSYGFSIGGSIHYASRLAEGRADEGNRIFATILKLLLAVYVITAALGLLFLPQLMRLLGADPSETVVRSYIRTQLIFVPIMFCQGPFFFFVNADNGPKTAALAMSVSGILDAVFSYVFVLRMHLGVAGSVYSTVVGAVIMLCITGRHILLKRGELRFRSDPMHWQAVADAAKTGFATALQYLFQFITMIAVNRMFIRLGGEVAVAAFGVIYNISLLCAAVPEAAVVATEPMLSSYRSERNLSNVRDTLRLSVLWSLLLSAGLMILLLIFPDWFGRFFGMGSGTALEYTARGVSIYAASILPAMLNIVFSGYYQAMLREKLTYLITFLRTFLFYLASLWICSRNGMASIWNIFAVTELLTLLVWLPAALKRGGLLQLRGIDVSCARSVVIDSKAQNVSGIVQELQGFARARGANEKQAMYIALVVEEISCAVMERFPERMGEIYVQATVVMDGENVVLYLRDNTSEFNPLAEDTEGIALQEGERPDLMGVRIVQKKAKEFYYRRYSGFNTLVIRM